MSSDQPEPWCDIHNQHMDKCISQDLADSCNLSSEPKANSEKTGSTVVPKTAADILEQKVKEWAESYDSESNYTMGKKVGAMHSVNILRDLEENGELAEARAKNVRQEILDKINQRIEDLTEEYFREETEVCVDSVLNCEQTEKGELCQFCWMKEVLYNELEDLREAFNDFNQTWEDIEENLKYEVED